MPILDKMGKQQQESKVSTSHITLAMMNAPMDKTSTGRKSCQYDNVPSESVSVDHCGSTRGDRLDPPAVTTWLADKREQSPVCDSAVRLP